MWLCVENYRMDCEDSVAENSGAFASVDDVFVGERGA